MTREKMASELCIAASRLHSKGFNRLAEINSDASAELRKTCDACRGFERIKWGPEDKGTCRAWNTWVPVDGSGFCHRWEAKP